MLYTISTTVPALLKPPLAPLKIVDTYLLNKTNNNLFQINTKLNATANPIKTLYQPHTAPDIGPSANSQSSSLVPTVNPKNPSPVITQIYTVPFVEMNKSVKTFDRLDCQYTTENFLNQTGVDLKFTMGEQPLGPLAYNQWHKTKTPYIHCSLSGISLRWFLRRMEVTKMTGLPLCLLLKNNFLVSKLHITHKLKLRI